MCCANCVSCAPIPLLQAIISTFKRIYFDAGDKPLKFFTVGATAQPEILQENLKQHAPLSSTL